MLSLAVCAVVLACAAFALMTYKDRTHVSSPPHAPGPDVNREFAVVYYSRSGHSEAVAREVARKFHAPIARIDAEYPRSLTGQSKAAADARAAALPQLQVEPHDLAPAGCLYLVSPTWLFRPAPPLWAFVENVDIHDQRIVLVMTGNSRYEQDQLDAFAERIRAKGGQLVRHVFLRRGRFFWQMSREELLQQTREQVGPCPMD